LQDFLHAALTAAPIVPLIEADDPGLATAVAGALAAGGIRVVEVVQRTARALDCLAAVAEAQPQLIVGAGTVLSTLQAEACIDRGARLIVSPGLDPAIVRVVRAQAIDVLPGIMTPSEAQHAVRLDIDTVKFFPAAAAGGPGMIGALAAAFRRLRFVPTGGISPANLGAYLALDAVIACGGSWMTPQSALDARDLGRIGQLASDAMAIAAGLKPGVEPA